MGSSHRHTLRQAAQVSPRRPPPAQGQERSNTWHPARRWATSGFGSGFGRPQAYQHVYMFALYGLLAMKSVFLDDFFTLAGGAIGPVRVPALGAGDAALLWGGKALFFAAFVGAPAAASSRSAAGLAALWLTSEAAAGWLLALLFQARQPCPALCGSRRAPPAAVLAAHGSPAARVVSG